MIGLGIVLGNGAVYFFNRIPGKWLCDYDEEPDEELLHPTHQRVRSTPWKYLFTGLFTMIGLLVGPREPLYALAVLPTCWLLLEMSIADIKYRIVPDQLIMLLVVCGMGFIPYHKEGPMEGFFGALLGFGIMLIIAVVGKLVYRKDTLGGGDIKLLAVIGFYFGLPVGLFVMAAACALGACATLLLQRSSRGAPDSQPGTFPLGPAIAVSAIAAMQVLCPPIQLLPLF